MVNFEKGIKLYFFESQREKKDTAGAARLSAIKKYKENPLSDIHIVDDIKDATVMVAFGGDGTFLEAQRCIAETPNNDIALLGLGYGTANKLMNQPSDLRTLLLSKDMQVIYTHPLIVSYSTGNGIYQQQMAFNEVVFHRSSPYNQVCHLDIDAGSIKGKTKSDGIIFSKAQNCCGGYSFHAGGKFLDIWSNDIVSCPICDRSKDAKPLSCIIPSSQKIVVNVEDFVQRPVLLNADNNEAVKNVVRCEIETAKDICVPVLWGDTVPIMQKNLRIKRRQELRLKRLQELRQRN